MEWSHEYFRGALAEKLSDFGIEVNDMEECARQVGELVTAVLAIFIAFTLFPEFIDFIRDAMYKVLRNPNLRAAWNIMCIGEFLGLLTGTPFGPVNETDGEDEEEDEEDEESGEGEEAVLKVLKCKVVKHEIKAEPMSPDSPTSFAPRYA